MPRKKILFTIGTPNQTTQMHQIASLLADDYDCWFTQFYPDTWYEKAVLKMNLLEQTIMSGHWKHQADEYVAEHGLQVDYMAQKNDYDMAVLCSELIVPRKLRSAKTVWIQEGMIDKLTPWAKFVKKSQVIPRYFAMNTSLNGSADMCDLYCAASQGYKNFLSNMGTSAGKIAVTGIPNFDNIPCFRTNDFPLHDYVMVATSDIRESFSKDDRVGFLKNCVKIAKGRKLLFKLHPNEIRERAIAEIRQYTPADSLVYTDGNSNEMVANCDVLITQFSSLAFVGIVLDKEVHSYFDVEELRRLTPLQNGGTSAQNIAGLCRGYIEYNGTSQQFLKQYRRSLNTVAA